MPRLQKKWKMERAARCAKYQALRRRNNDQTDNPPIDDKRDIKASTVKESFVSKPTIKCKKPVKEITFEPLMTRETRRKVDVQNQAAVWSWLEDFLDKNHSIMKLPLVRVYETYSAACSNRGDVPMPQHVFKRTLLKKYPKGVYCKSGKRIQDQQKDTQDQEKNRVKRQKRREDRRVADNMDRVMHVDKEEQKTDVINIQKRKGMSAEDKRQLAKKRLDCWLDAHLKLTSQKEMKCSSVHDIYTDHCNYFGVKPENFPTFTTALSTKFQAGFASKHPNSLELTPKNVETLSEAISEAFGLLGNPAVGVRFAVLKQQLISCHPEAMEAASQLALCEICLRKGEAPEEPDPDLAISRCLQRAIGNNEVLLISGEQRGGSYLLRCEQIGKFQPGTHYKGTRKREDNLEHSAGKKLVYVNKLCKPLEFKVPNFPELLEEVFPLAMVYMTKPKEALFLDIADYLQEHYLCWGPMMHELPKSLANGCSKGYWERLKYPRNTTYRLLKTDFSPDGDSQEVQVANAILACTEPRHCSIKRLKLYIQKYHSNFITPGVPLLIKPAIKRALNRGLISKVKDCKLYTLTGVFTPSPDDLCKKYEVQYDVDHAPAPVLHLSEIQGLEEAVLTKKTNVFNIPQIGNVTMLYPPDSLANGELGRADEVHVTVSANLDEAGTNLPSGCGLLNLLKSEITQNFLEQQQEKYEISCIPQATMTGAVRLDTDTGTNTANTCDLCFGNFESVESLDSHRGCHFDAPCRLSEVAILQHLEARKQVSSPPSLPADLAKQIQAYSSLQDLHTQNQAYGM